MPSYPSSLCLTSARHASGIVDLPGSKSLSNRALLLAALSDGETTLENILHSDDTAVMLEALRKLGVKYQKVSTAKIPTYIVAGHKSYFPCLKADIFVGNAGTAVRPLLAALAITGGEYLISGVKRMHERPIGDLVDALRQLGANIHYLEHDGYPPLRVYPSKITLPSSIKIKGNVSSQFLSSLLMAMPLVYRIHQAIKACTICVEGELISRPYINLTIALLERFGIIVQQSSENVFTVPLQPLCSPGNVFIEGDASSASYFLAAGAIAGGSVRVNGVGNKSCQGDIAFLSALRDMGANVCEGADWLSAASPSNDKKLQAIDIDCNHMPDAAMTLAIVALFAEGVTRLTGIASWRVKETDRIQAMVDGLLRLGAVVEYGNDFLSINPPKQFPQAVTIDTYEDHRIAMCFALARFAGVNVTINNPACVSKTFPDFFDFFDLIV